MRVTNEKGQEFLRFHNVLLIASRAVTSFLEEEIISQRYEAEEIAFALQYCEPDDIVLELGAGVGALSSVLLKSKPVQQVICVEANPDLVALIKKNHQVNALPVCEVLNGVLTNDNEQKQLDFYITHDFWASSLIQPAEFQYIKKVQTYSFNDVLAQYKPTFIICDIEGGEYELFVETVDLSCVNKVCLEVHKASPKELVDLYAYFVDAGFRLLSPPFQPGVRFFQRPTA